VTAVKLLPLPSPSNFDNDKSELPGRMWEGSGEDTICKYTGESKLIKTMTLLKRRMHIFQHKALSYDEENSVNNFTSYLFSRYQKLHSDSELQINEKCFKSWFNELKIRNFTIMSKEGSC
jgi:hypothetical protein